MYDWIKQKCKTTYIKKHACTVAHIDLVSNISTHWRQENPKQSISVGGQYLTDSPYDGTSKSQWSAQDNQSYWLQTDQIWHPLQSNFAGHMDYSIVQVNATMKYHYIMSIKCIILEYFLHSFLHICYFFSL